MIRLELSRPVVHLNTTETRVQLSFSAQHHSLLLEAVGKVFPPAVSQVLHARTHAHTQMYNLKSVNTNLAANVG